MSQALPSLPRPHTRTLIAAAAGVVIAFASLAYPVLLLGLGVAAFVGLGLAVRSGAAGADHSGEAERA